MGSWDLPAAVMWLRARVSCKGRCVRVGSFGPLWDGRHGSCAWGGRGNCARMRWAGPHGISCALKFWLRGCVRGCVGGCAVRGAVLKPGLRVKGRAEGLGLTKTNLGGALRGSLKRVRRGPSPPLPIPPLHPNFCVFGLRSSPSTIPRRAPRRNES